MKKLKNFALVILCLGAITLMGACDKKVSSEKTASRADQIAYLKAHEQEMTDMLKRNHPKIESIQWQWDTVEAGIIGNGTPRGGGILLTLDGKFNHVEESEFTVGFELKSKNDYPSLDHMYMMQSFSVLRGGGWIDYE